MKYEMGQRVWYVSMKVSDLISRAVPQPVPKSRRIEHMGWVDGYLLVRFWDSGTLYIYGPNVSAVEVDKLLRVPFPDKLFITNVKNKFKCHKVLLPVSDTNGNHPDDVLKVL